MTKQHSPAFWDGASEYQRVVHPFTAAFARDALAQTPLSPDAFVLDVACGTGALALAAAEAGHRVLATDFSPGMIARVSEAAHPNIETRVLDGQALDLPDAAVDASFSIFGVMLFPDWRAGLAEMARVTGPGGTGTIATWAHPHGAAINMALVDIALRIAPDLVGPPPSGGMEALRTPERLEAEMTRAGFAEVRATRVMHPFTMPVAQLDDDQPYGFNDLWQKMTPQQQAEVRAELRANATDGEVHIASTALIAVARKA